MTPRTILRIEGGATLAAALYGYYLLDGPWWLLAVLALAPDLSMLGYLVDERIGSVVYNLGHTYTLPVALGAVGYGLDARILLLGALVWAGHIGADRLVGYGLKLTSGFDETHLSHPTAERKPRDRVPKPR
ncbi:DUF4260 domain-containing protein [Halobellus rubicundus]|uniref:DUF4260 domain-containing protein n=1 Tax=Halobellus rubicundus TaxID=2996466 RepID=A0ABD5M9X6_9EURY